jgi:hypothetical protein
VPHATRMRPNGLTHRPISSDSPDNEGEHRHDTQHRCAASTPAAARSTSVAPNLLLELAVWPIVILPVARLQESSPVSRYGVTSGSIRSAMGWAVNRPLLPRYAPSSASSARRSSSEARQTLRGRLRGLRPAIVDHPASHAGRSRRVLHRVHLLLRASLYSEPPD